MTIRILKGDCRDVLRTLPDDSVHCVCTSPPYWGLRSYGVGTDKGEIGLEGSFAGYVEIMRNVFGEVRRVLRPDGTLWLNLGDSYGGGGTIGRNDTTPEAPARRAAKYGTGTGNGSLVGASGSRAPAAGLKPKDLCGIPWRVAFALQADGWYLRSDIIWSKPNPMPESVTDRPTKAHEYLFLMSKSERYWYDAEAIKEEYSLNTNAHGKAQTPKADILHSSHQTNGNTGFIGWDDRQNPNGRNRRSVWEIATAPFSEAHFATFPPALIEPCILAGCPKDGTVLDPFGGAGTTGLVADRLGRNAVLIELNPEYADMAERRIRGDAGMFAQVAAE